MKTSWRLSARKYVGLDVGPRRRDEAVAVDAGRARGCGRGRLAALRTRRVPPAGARSLSRWVTRSCSSAVPRKCVSIRVGSVIRHDGSRCVRPRGVYDTDVMLELTAAQVDQIVLQASRQTHGTPLTSAILGINLAEHCNVEDPRLSRSLSRGLIVLATMPRDGGPAGVVEIANRLEMSPSTTHRLPTDLGRVRAPRARRPDSQVPPPRPRRCRRTYPVIPVETGASRGATSC